MAAVKMLFLGEHVHRAAFPFGIAALASGQFCHDAVGIHAAGQHVAVIAVGCDALVAFLGRSLQAHNNGFLSDIEVAKAADEAHAVQLACFFFEPADQQHIFVIGCQFFRRDIRFCSCGFCCGFARGHGGGPPPVRNSLALNYSLQDSERSRECHCAARESCVQAVEKYIVSANDDFVGAQHTQDRPCLFVQQVQIKEVIRQPLGQVFHLVHLRLNSRQLHGQIAGLGVNLGPAEQAIVALHSGKGEIDAQGEGHGEKDKHPQSGACGAVHLRSASCRLLMGGRAQYGTGDSLRESPFVSDQCLPITCAVIRVVNPRGEMRGKKAKTLFIRPGTTSRLPIRACNHPNSATSLADIGLAIFNRRTPSMSAASKNCVAVAPGQSAVTVTFEPRNSSATASDRDKT
mmetsp:Transcript_29037/g.55776  ORF Transcript_29037/g.55776 Transcript_29037/m.55776 type:complete len:403 (+) Transcript_29037:2528-3736(+)